MAFYIIGSVLFGVVIGALYAKARAKEVYLEKEQKFTKIISNKNDAIISLKNNLRSIQRKHEAINQGYQLQTKLVNTQEQEIKKLQEQYNDLEVNFKAAQQDFLSLKSENRDLSKSLSNKFKQTDEQNEIIALLETKIKDYAKMEKQSN